MNISDRSGAQYQEKRRCLLDHPLMRVEGAVGRGVARWRTSEVLTPQFQIVLPLSGAFVWHLGASQSLLTANHVLCIESGAVSRDTLVDEQPVEILLLTPHPQALQQLLGDGFGAHVARSGGASRVLGAPARLQHCASRFWNLGCRGADNGDREEAAFELMDLAAATLAARPAALPGRASTLVGRVKELIGAGRDRLSLTSIAAQLGASPAYLTSAFRRSEGITIAHYHRRLRLARALAQLPDTHDITALALELGFSSHAHFSTAFRAAYGESPSTYRARTHGSGARKGAVHFDTNLSG